MEKKYVFAEAFLMMIVLQALLMLIKAAADPLVPATSFAHRVVTMVSMLLLAGIVSVYAKLRKTQLSVFPARFSKRYIVYTVIAAVLLAVTPSNFTGGYEPILLLLYGSVVTPVYEELVFRGYLWNRLSGVLPRELYVYIWSVLLFSIWHLGYMVPQMIDGNWFAVMTKLAAGFVYGVILGFVRLKCKNCYAAMLVHGVLNAVMI
ncbi:MAG: CPBP family intramembrane glutamic endopeptidase [Oscillospiraceae bacterium]|nr:CPBP family intramembrane glutamic endopeptidase [Oscillospiraceae bacterium]